MSFTSLQNSHIIAHRVSDMATFLEFLESEIAKTGLEIDVANIKFNHLKELRKKFLDMQGTNRQVAKAADNLVNATPSLSSRAELNPVEDNKTHLVLEIVLAHQPHGIKAGEVFAEIERRGISIKRNYVYSILNRQKKNGAIQHKRGRYYATLGAFAPTPIGGKAEAKKTETASE